MLEHRIFYTTSNRESGVVDVESVDSEHVDGDLYHANQDDSIQAIKLFDDKDDRILVGEDRRTETLLTRHIREKQYKYEQYIVGGGYYATSTEVKFSGETTTRFEHNHKKTCIRVRDDTVISGQGSLDNSWQWNIESVGKEVDAKIVSSGPLFDLFDKKCVMIGSDEKELSPIDVFHRVSE